VLFQERESLIVCVSNRVSDESGQISISEVKKGGVSKNDFDSKVSYPHTHNINIHK